VQSISLRFGSELFSLVVVAPTSRVMAVAIMASMVAFLDSTVVNLALPATERAIGGGLATQQWVVDGYLLALAAVGAVLTSTPLTALNLSSVAPEHGGIASAIQNAAGRLSALIATACVGLIAASTLTDASFGRVLQVAAVLFFIAAVVGAVTNPTVPVEPVSCEVAALCHDRHDAHPQLAHASVDGGRLAAEDQGS
jgi:hypothetical protein